MEPGKPDSQIPQLEEGGMVILLFRRKKWRHRRIQAFWLPNRTYTCDPKPFGHFAHYSSGDMSRGRLGWMILRKRAATGWSPRGTWRRD